MQMAERKSVRLKVVPAPITGHAVSAPPVLQASSRTVNYQCGECGTVLLRAEEGQVHNFLICTKCDAYNSTDL